MPRKFRPVAHALPKALAAAVAMAACAMPTSAEAHHSFAQFDLSKCAQIKGVVKKFKFTYPHSWLWIEAAGSEGPQTLWAFETNDPASLAVRGWRPNTLKPGDKVALTYSPLRDGRNGGALRAVVGPDGKPLPVEAIPCPAKGTH